VSTAAADLKSALDLKPAGWTPRPGVRARVVPTKRNPEPPAGTYRLLDRAPGGWWGKPADPEAQAWAETHAGLVVQGHVELSGRLTSAAVAG